jgi:hypothetical protein
VKRDRLERARGNREVPPKNGAGKRADLSGAIDSARRKGGPRGKRGFPRATEPKAREVA